VWWSLLKVREGNYKSVHGGTRWKMEAKSLFQRLTLLTLVLTYGKEGTSCFPTNNG
jgi:hypothetical protein